MPELEELHVDGNGIGKFGVSALVFASTKGAFKKLQLLSLGRNQLGDEGMIALAIALGDKAWAKLQTLNVDENGISDSGIITFSRYIAADPTVLPSLEELKLGGNPITDTGITAFSNALESEALQKLEVVFVDAQMIPLLDDICRRRNITIYDD